MALRPAPTVRLPHGAFIPRIGLGTWPMDNAQTADAVVTAIEVGYRLFDTAQNYGNEEGVGEGIRRSGIGRAEVFVSTKFNKEFHSVNGVRQAFENSCARLGVDYIDLLTVHWPIPDQNTYDDAVRGLTQLLDEGLIKAVGVSNFKPSHLQRLFDEGLTVDVNQIQLDPRHTRDAIREVHGEHGIRTMSWSPIGRDSGLREEPVIVELATKYGKTPSQIILSWHVQQAFIAIPKASSRLHLEENLDIFDFELSEDEVQQLLAMDTGETDILQPETFGH
jgi:2,5-diketo-D-gluconate reductase A